MWTAIEHKCYEMYFKHVPIKLDSQRMHNNRWMSKESLKVIKQRVAAWKRYTIFNSNCNYTEYKRSGTRQREWTNQERFNNLSTGNGRPNLLRKKSKRFDAYIRNKQSVKTKVTRLQKPVGE